MGVILAISAKKTDAVANFSLFKCLSGKQEPTWNQIYHAYAIIFGSLNLLTIPANLTNYGHHEMLALVGFVVTVIYYIEAYRSIQHSPITEPVEESTPARCHVRFLKLIGRYPRFMRLLILALSIGYVGTSKFINGRDYYSYYYREGGSMNNVVAGIVIFICVFDILIATFKRIRNRLEKAFGESFVHYDMRFTLTLVMATFLCVGTIISLCGHVDIHIADTTLMGVAFVFAILMTFAERYTKAPELPTVIANNKSMLPKNLAKNIFNPIILDTGKTPLQGENPEIQGYDYRPLLQ